MDWSRLAGPLMDAGLIILGSAIGGPAGGIATTIGREIARELGVDTPQEAARAIENDPQAVETLRGYEAAHAEELALLGQEQRHMSEILAREDKGPWWQHAWRPAMMWLIGFLWLNNLFLTPLLFNAILKLGVPLAPFDALITLSGLYMSLYLGGHTVLRAMREKK
jgi:hypothetical protein